MIRSFPLAAVFSLCMGSAVGQTYGVLVAGCRDDLYAAGLAIAPQQGLSVRLFMPFYVYDRLVIRTEAGVSALSSEQTGTDGQTSTSRTVSADLAVLCRYYVRPRLSFSTGLEAIQRLKGRAPIAIGQSEAVPARTDFCLLAGTAYRLTDRWELGFRLGQGLLPAMDMGAYGTAHHRYAFIMASFLLKSKAQGFAKRRLWRNPMDMGPRY